MNPEQNQTQTTTQAQPQTVVNPPSETQQPTVPQQPPTPKDEFTIKKGSLPVKTLLLIIVLAAVAAGLIYVGLNYVPPEKVQPVANNNATLENPAQTILSISSTPVKLSTPSAYSTDILINTGQDAVNKVQIEISYNPKQLSNVSIVQGKFFTNPQILLNNVDQENGRVTFALGVNPNEAGVVGQGIVARLNFTAYQQVATASVVLLPKSEARADNYSQSVIKSTINSLINLNEYPFRATNSAK